MEMAQMRTNLANHQVEDAQHFGEVNKGLAIVTTRVATWGAVMLLLVPVFTTILSELARSWFHR